MGQGGISYLVITELLSVVLGLFSLLSAMLLLL